MHDHFAVNRPKASIKVSKLGWFIFFKAKHAILKCIFFLYICMSVWKLNGWLQIMSTNAHSICLLFAERVSYIHFSCRLLLSICYFTEVQAFLAKWFFKKIFKNSNKFSIILNYLPFKEGMALHLRKFES